LPEQLSHVLGQGELLDVQGRPLPLYRLGDLFGLRGTQTDATQALAVVVEDGGYSFCLLADEIVGQQQIVIKNLGETLRHLDGVAGGAILADGRVGLILDVAGLRRRAMGAVTADAA
jgi:two-component system chemotaxis sensor kinase CheA